MLTAEELFVALARDAVAIPVSTAPAAATEPKPVVSPTEGDTGSEEAEEDAPEATEASAASDPSEPSEASEAAAATGDARGDRSQLNRVFRLLSVRTALPAW